MKIVERWYMPKPLSVAVRRSLRLMPPLPLVYHVRSFGRAR